MGEWRGRLRAAWLEADPRSLGLFRIGLAILLLADLLRRIPDLATWYSNQGLVPNHTQLWRPPSEYLFSLFFLASHPGEAAFGFALCGLVFLGLLVGWKTRLFQVLSLVAVVSLHSRAVVLLNGGDVVMNLLVAWSCFLPLGRRFSIDSLVASMRRHREVVAADLALERRPAPDTTPVVALAFFALLLQFATIYFFNTVHKTGATWREGSVVHYVLHQDRIVTALGLLLRDGFPLWLSRLLAYGTLAVEGLAPLLLLTPVAHVQARRAAMVLLPAMHLGFALFLNVGLFSPTMMLFYLLLPTAADWELLANRLRGAGRPPLRVYFDAGCGICFQVVRVLARLDAFGRLELLGNDGPLPKGVSRQLVERTIVVVDPATGARFERARAFAAIFAALPLGRPLSWLLRAPLVSSLADRAYDAVARNRQAISVELGLAACGLPGVAGPALREQEAPWRSTARAVGARLRDLLVVVLLLALGSQVLRENRAVPRWLKLGQGELFQAIVEYPRLFQGWSMFAPEAPRTDAVVVVDALTVDGRRVDPLNYASTGWTGEPWTEIPERLGQDQFWCDYQARIKGHGALHAALRTWLLAHHRRTGNENDRIVAFEAWLIEDDSPAPGGSKPSNVRRERFLSFGRLRPEPPGGNVAGVD